LNVTGVGDELHEKLDGTVVRLILVGLLMSVLSVGPEMFWLHVTLSEELPEPVIATNEMLSGSAAHVALGEVA